MAVIFCELAGFFLFFFCDLGMSVSSLKNLFYPYKHKLCGSVNWAVIRNVDRLKVKSFLEDFGGSWTLVV